MWRSFLHNSSASDWVEQKSWQILVLLLPTKPLLAHFLGVNDYILELHFLGNDFVKLIGDLNLKDLRPQIFLAFFFKEICTHNFEFRTQPLPSLLESYDMTSLMKLSSFKW